MKRSRVGDQQIIGVLREQGWQDQGSIRWIDPPTSGTKVSDPCRKHGMSSAKCLGPGGDVGRHGRRAIVRHRFRNDGARRQAAEGARGRECRARAALRRRHARQRRLDGSAVEKTVKVSDRVAMRSSVGVVAPLMGWMASAPGIAMCHGGCSWTIQRREPSMDRPAIIGLDPAKSVFQGEAGPRSWMDPRSPAERRERRRHGRVAAAAASRGRCWPSSRASSPA